MPGSHLSSPLKKPALRSSGAVHRPFFVPSFQAAETGPNVQAKLEIGQPGDRYEREADQVADQVVQRRPLRGTVLQTKCEKCEQDELLQEKEDGQEEVEPDTAALSDQLRHSRGGGSPIPAAVRTEMEGAMGADFSSVRVHTGQNAIQMSRQLNAQAFTHGSNVYFNSGKFAPQTGEGKHLLAHELVHTIQQGAVSGQVLPKRGTPKANIQRNQVAEEARLSQISSGSQFTPHASLAPLPAALATNLAGATSLSTTRTIVQQAGEQLWETARQVVQTHRINDDRPLYWIRLQMRRTIRTFNPGSSFTLTAQQRQGLIEQFTLTSRGMQTSGTGLTFAANAKRILISGFDPFGFSSGASIGMSNPSGAAALALDGTTVTNGSTRGHIQAVTLPVSFDFFNQGRVEQFFRPFISGSQPVHMVMTISWGGGTAFELEEFAARHRNPGHRDNENERGMTPGSLGPGNAFLQSTLPRGDMRQGALNRGRGPTTGEREFSGRRGQTTVTHNTQSNPLSLPQSILGSGGDFLSNEVFYRTSLLRATAANKTRRSLPVGHLHVPDVQAVASQRQISPAAARDRIINTIRELIKSALPHI